MSARHPCKIHLSNCAISTARPTALLPLLLPLLLLLLLLLLIVLHVVLDVQNKATARGASLTCGGHQGALWQPLVQVSRGLDHTTAAYQVTSHVPTAAPLLRASRIISCGTYSCYQCLPGQPGALHGMYVLLVIVWLHCPA